MGFATKLVQVDEKDVPTQSIRHVLMRQLKAPKQVTTHISLDADELMRRIEARLVEFQESLKTEIQKEEKNKLLKTIGGFFDAKK